MKCPSHFYTFCTQRLQINKQHKLLDVVLHQQGFYSPAIFVPPPGILSVHQAEQSTTRCMCKCQQVNVIYKIAFSSGSPIDGTQSAPPYPLAYLRGLFSKGRGRKRTPTFQYKLHPWFENIVVRLPVRYQFIIVTLSFKMSANSTFVVRNSV